MSRFTDDPPTETGKQFMDHVRTWLASLPAAGRIVGQSAISHVHVVAGANRLVVLDDRQHTASGA